MAVANAEEDIAEELVRLINEMNEDPLDVLSIKCGDLQSTPLHLAASFGSIRMCKCIIGTSTDHGQDHKQHIHKQLLGFRNSFSATPMYTAVQHAKKDTFLWLYELCDNSAQAYDYCHANQGITVLHVAIAGGYWDLAFQIIHRLEGLMDCVNDLGNSPLCILAQTANAFRSSINLSFFQNIIYNCIYVEKLIVSTTFKEKKKVKSLGYPNNYQACFNFLQVPWKIIKLLGQHSSTRAQGRVSPTIYDKCLNFIGLVLSKLVDRSIIVGSTEIRTLKEIKEMHVWSVQIMNKLLEHALRSEDEMNPQNDGTSEAQCYSEYGVFRRGKAFSTPILDAARNGIIEMVEKILQVFPMTIHDRTGDGSNTVLIAVEFRKSHIYDFLLRRRSYIVDKDLAFRQRDNNWNTILHQAGLPANFIHIPTSILQLQWEIKWYEYVKKTLPTDFYVDRNRQDKIPWEIFTETHEKLLTKSKHWLNNICNSCSVIAALISTLSFASSATVPGGVDQHTGEPIFQHHLAFKLFAISSLVALCSSFISLLIFFSILMSKHDYQDFNMTLPRNLILGLTFLFISMAAMLLCFSSGHFLMLDEHFKYAAFPVYALTFLAISYFSLKQFPLYFVLLKATFEKVPQRHLIYRQDQFYDFLFSFT